ncbi:unnamed protein product [Clonostachys byssicola]|uniref:Zn(2)-C6 fungal-type domain-containing protein n=1 Tax=Clonostachys byssicola TaxID=160290 RepID=A0A9N9UI48_9HYPO|nr:unnamed protein product [Clonostachys byssicola]
MSQSSTIRKRASLACQACRSRKVRCDVARRPSGTPCGNCLWKNLDCVIPLNRRLRPNFWQRKAKQAQAKADMSSGHPLGAALGMLPTPSSSDADDVFGDSLNKRFSTDNLSTLMDVPRVEMSESSFFTDFEQIPEYGNSPFGDTLNATYLSPPDSFPEEDFTLYPTQFPPYIRPLPPNVNQDESDYLRLKGAFDLPPWPVQKPLLQAFIEYVHPRFPMLETTSLINLLDERKCEEPISLLLYQAVLYSGAVFVDMDFLFRAGYSTRNDARKNLCEKIKLLYTFDCELDRLSIVQSLLLLASWYEASEDLKDCWHWSGVAISLAQSFGLHRNSEDLYFGLDSSPLPEEALSSRKRAWKRTWWCCFMYDRLLALGLRYPTRIADEDFDVPMLTEDDFEPIQYDIPASFQQDLVSICLARAQLCRFIGRVLDAQYSTLLNHETSDHTNYRVALVCPKKNFDNIDTVSSLYLELSDWAESLPEACRHKQQPCRLDVNAGQGSVIIQRVMLQMEYQALISALYRPLYDIKLTPGDFVQSQAQHTARVCVQNSATTITRLLRDLKGVRLCRYLSNTCISIILPTSIVHLNSMGNPSLEVRKVARREFNLCISALGCLRGRNTEAERARTFLAGIIGSNRLVS